MSQTNQQRLENLGPAERMINALLTHTDHLYHGRAGMEQPSAAMPTSVSWRPVTTAVENGQTVVYLMSKTGKKTDKVRVGVLDGDRIVDNAGGYLGTFRKPGISPKVAEWMYRQVAEVWKLDNEFAAKWASWAFTQDHRDLKTILAAFMLVQNRSGEPVMDDGKVSFFDDDYRAVGEAMCFIRDKVGFNPKMLLRIGEVLDQEGVAQINRELGFGRSSREPAKGRYTKAIMKWLHNQEVNPKSLETLVKAGFRTSVMALARRVGYKPVSVKFFETLRWKQKQAQDGRRTLAIGVELAAAESWEGLTETQICQKIVTDKPNYKRLVGMLPKSVGLTRAIMAAAIESKCVSDQDLIILTPTLEDLGLLKVASIEARFKKACEAATNQRALNVARNVKRATTVAALQEAADKANAKVAAESLRGIRLYVVVDKSGSMQQSLETAKKYLTRLLGGFPLDKMHVSVFNSFGAKVEIKAPTAQAVEMAFRGHTAGGGTTHSEGVRVLLQDHKPAADEDAVFLFVGDEGEYSGTRLAQIFSQFGVTPAAFGMLKVEGENGNCVHDAAGILKIPCFDVGENIFEDPYAVTRTLQRLIAATPVSQNPTRTVYAARRTLVQQILDVKLLEVPVAFRCV